MSTDPHAETEAGAATPTDATQTATPDLRAGRGTSGATRYGSLRVEGLLGRGGMGVVYRAVDEVLGREVAVKVVGGTALGTEARARLLREARALAALHHRNVCTVHQAGEAEGEVFIAMEKLPGPTVAEVIKERGCVGVAEAVRLAGDIAAGLAHAHAAGLVHRDLKPGNVMLGEGGEAKLVDFGLARAMDAAAEPATVATAAAAAVGSASTESRIAGTPLYMAPEQVEGGAIDARADVWAFGLIVHELVTGTHPFAGLTTAALMEAIRAGRPALQLPARGVPAGLTALVRDCLARDPAARPADGAALVARLARLARTRRRRWWLAGAVMAAALALAAGSVAARVWRSPAASERLSRALPPAPALALMATPDDGWSEIVTTDHELLPVSSDQYVLRAAGEPPTLVGLDGRRTPLPALPDGQRFDDLILERPGVVTCLGRPRDGGGRPSAWRLDLSELTWRRFAENIELRVDDTFALPSPDGEWLAIGGTREIRIYQVGSAGPWFLHAVEAGAIVNPFDVAWAEDGSGIAFVVLRPRQGADSVDWIDVRSRRSRALMGPLVLRGPKVADPTLARVGDGFVTVAHMVEGSILLYAAVDERERPAPLRRGRPGDLVTSFVDGAWWITRTDPEDAVQVHAPDGSVATWSTAGETIERVIGWVGDELRVRTAKGHASVSARGVVPWSSPSGSSPLMATEEATLEWQGQGLVLATASGATEVRPPGAGERLACSLDLRWCALVAMRRGEPARWFELPAGAVHDGPSLPESLMVAASPGDARLVATLDGSEVIVSDLIARTSRAYSVGMRQPQQLAFSRDGRTLYVAGMYAGEKLYVAHAIDLATGEVTALDGSSTRYMHSPSPRADGAVAIINTRMTARLMRRAVP